MGDAVDKHVLQYSLGIVEGVTHAGQAGAEERKHYSVLGSFFNWDSVKAMADHLSHMALSYSWNRKCDLQTSIWIGTSTNL